MDIKPEKISFYKTFTPALPQEENITPLSRLCTSAASTISRNEHELLASATKITEKLQKSFRELTTDKEVKLWLLEELKRATSPASQPDNDIFYKDLKKNPIELSRYLAVLLKILNTMQHVHNKLDAAQQILINSAKKVVALTKQEPDEPISLDLDISQTADINHINLTLTITQPSGSSRASAVLWTRPKNNLEKLISAHIDTLVRSSLKKTNKPKEINEEIMQFLYNEIRDISNIVHISSNTSSAFLVELSKIKHGLWHYKAILFRFFHNIFAQTGLSLPYRESLKYGEIINNLIARLPENKVLLERYVAYINYQTMQIIIIISEKEPSMLKSTVQTLLSGITSLKINKFASDSGYGASIEELTHSQQRTSPVYSQSYPLSRKNPEYTKPLPDSQNLHRGRRALSFFKLTSSSSNTTPAQHQQLQNSVYPFNQPDDIPPIMANNISIAPLTLMTTTTTTSSSLTTTTQSGGKSSTDVPKPATTTDNLPPEQ